MAVGLWLFVGISYLRFTTYEAFNNCKSDHQNQNDYTRWLSLPKPPSINIAKTGEDLKERKEIQIAKNGEGLKERKEMLQNLKPKNHQRPKTKDFFAKDGEDLNERKEMLQNLKPESHQ